MRAWECANRWRTVGRGGKMWIQVELGVKIIIKGRCYAKTSFYFYYYFISLSTSHSYFVAFPPFHISHQLALWPSPFHKRHLPSIVGTTFFLCAPACSTRQLCLFLLLRQYILKPRGSRDYNSTRGTLRSMKTHEIKLQEYNSLL